MEEAGEVEEDAKQSPPAENPPEDAAENAPNTAENPPDEAVENLPEEAVANPLEEAVANPQEEAVANPPEEAVENPHGDEEREAVEGPAEVPAATGDDSLTELPTALQGQSQDDDAPFPEALDGQYGGDLEDGGAQNMDEVVDIDGRPPPMAPPPAIFYREEAPDDVPDATALGSEFMEEATLKKPSKRIEIAAPAEKKLEIPKRVPPKIKPTYPYRARVRTDAQIDAAMRKVPPRHDYCGLIYSAMSQRPRGGYTNYFLPIYRQPIPKQHVQIAGLSVPMEKITARKELLPKELLPLSTVKVTWPSNRTRTVYKPEGIYAYLTRFGPIDAVFPKSVNSAYVIFSDLEAAKACIQCTDLGRPWDPLIAFWAEPRMYNSSFYSKYASAEILPIRVRI